MAGPNQYPTNWQVNCNGYTGLLIYQVDPTTYKVNGILLGTPVEGFLVGRHLQLHRAPKGTQLYDGWIIDHRLGAHGQPYYNQQYFIAGTVSEYQAGAVDGIYPWYGVAVTGGIQSGNTGFDSNTFVPGGWLGKDITLDFETGSTKGWVKTGTAFNHQPTYGDNPTARRRGQPSKHIGNYWIGTYEKYQGYASQTPGSIQGDGPKGTLTSNVFTIPSGSLSFLVGGGSSFQTRVELLVSGNRVLYVSGRNTETMQRVKWNLNPWAGQQGQIRLVDDASGGWGHINADDFRFSVKSK